MKFEVGKVYNAMFSHDNEQRSFLVLSDNEDGTFDVRWNDGDEEWNYEEELTTYVETYKERMMLK